jgi:hypothetical protein
VVLGFPTPVDEPLGQPISVDPHAVANLDEIVSVGVSWRLPSISNSLRFLPLRMSIEASLKFLCPEYVQLSAPLP